MGQNLIEICSLWCTWSNIRLYLGFIGDKAVRGLICRHENTLTYKLKLALAKQHLASKMIYALICHVISEMFSTLHDTVAC